MASICDWRMRGCGSDGTAVSAIYQRLSKLENFLYFTVDLIEHLSSDFLFWAADFDGCSQIIYSRCKPESDVK